MIDLDAISAGLDAGEFFLEYMPTIALPDLRCVGAEALVRWRRPSGIVPPNDFIPIVENTRLSGILSYWVIEKVAADLGDWLRENDDIHLGINVPPEILGRGAVEYAFEKCGLKPVARKIILEVTERGVPDKMGVDAINEATRRGMRFALDDVGVSSANLMVMSRCNVHIIKLDKGVVGQLADCDQTPDWLTCVETLVRTMKMDVIAEGVESEEQLKRLVAAGVTMAQGYLFSRPLSRDQFLAYYKAKR